MSQKYRIIASDLLLVGLLVLLFLSGRAHNSQGANIYLYNVQIMAAIYFAARIIKTITPKLFFYLLLTTIIVSSLFETYYGLMQILGLKISNHHMFACTGSFINPGPYGGFLAICICLLGIYSLKCHNKILHYITGITALLAFLLLPSTRSRTAMLAVACAFLVYLISTEKGKNFFRKRLLLITIISVLCSAGAYMLKKPSADGRIFMDRISMRSILQNGLLGAGLGHFGGTYGDSQYQFFMEKYAKDSNNVIDPQILSDPNRLTADCPKYAFNEYLQLGVEAGPLAMVLFIALIINSIIISYKRNEIWCYGLLALAVFALFSYPMHIVEFRVMLVLLLAACTISYNKGQVSNIVLMLIVLCAMVTVLIDSHDKIRSSKEAATIWEETSKWYKIKKYEYLVEDGESLIDDMNHDEKFLFMYGQSLNKTGNHLKSDSLLKMGTELSSDPMFWNVMGNNSLALGKYREAEERYKHAFYMVPNRLYPLCLLAKLYHTEGDSVRFLEMSDMIETFIPKVESVNTEQLRAEIRELKASYISE